LEVVSGSLYIMRLAARNAKREVRKREAEKERQKKTGSVAWDFLFSFSGVSIEAKSELTVVEQNAGTGAGCYGQNSALFLP
jgi:hypothetical protein